MSADKPPNVILKPGGYARVRTICPYTGMIGRIVSMHGSSAILQFEDMYRAHSDRSTGAFLIGTAIHWVQSWFSKSELWPETEAAYKAQLAERRKNFEEEEAAEEAERQKKLEEEEAACEAERLRQICPEDDHPIVRYGDPGDTGDPGEGDSVKILADGPYLGMMGYIRTKRGDLCKVGGLNGEDATVDYPACKLVKVSRDEHTSWLVALRDTKGTL